MVNYKLYTNTLDEIINNLNCMLMSEDIKEKRIVAFVQNEIMCMCIYYLREKGVKVSAIIDNDRKKQGTTAYGLSVYSPKEYLGKFDDDVRVLLGSAFNMEMIDQLRNMGYQLGKHIGVVIDYKLAGHDYHFLDRSGMKEINEAEVRQSFLGTLRKVDSVCENNDIRYYLGFGTLLGAVRHKGFIPWDDDADIVMPIKDLRKLSEALKDDTEYSVLCLYNKEIDYMSVQSAVCDDSICCDMYIIPQFTCGFPVDIFPLVGLPSDKDERIWHIENIKKLEAMIWINYKDQSKKPECVKQLLELLELYDYDSSEYVTSLIGSYALTTIMKREIFDDYEIRQFEDCRLRVPKGYDEWLRSLYGDYMIPYKRSVQHEHAGYKYDI